MAHDVQAQVVRQNGQEPEQSCLIRNGDLWQIGSEEFLSAVAGQPPESELSNAIESECSVTISVYHGLPICHCFGKTVTIIGNALYCDLTFDEPRLQPQHYLIANVGGTWFLHSLVDSGGHDGWGGFYRVTNGEVFQVGRTQLKFHVRLRQPEAPAVPSPAVTAPEVAHKNATSGTATPAAAADSGIPVAGGVDATGQRSAEPAQAESVRVPAFVAGVSSKPNASVQTSPGPNSVGATDQVVLRAAQDVLNKIKAMHLRHRHQDGSLWGRIRRAKLWLALRSVESEFAANARIRAFHKLEGLLEQDPGDRTLLLTFVRMCDAAGFDDICFHALRLMALRDPDDRIVTRALARICTHLGRSEPTYLDKAVRYWRDALKQSPDERMAIESTIRGILVHKTTRKYERR